MRVQTVPDQLYLAVTQLEVGTRTSPEIGTGFFVGYTSEDRELQADFLVTNRHVVRAGNEGRFLLHRCIGDTPDVYLGPDLDSVLQVEIANWETAWVDHPDPLVDVSVMNLTSTVLGLARERKVPFYTKIEWGMFADDATLSAFDSLEEVLFVGFPEGISDEVHHLPVLRRGVTATPLAIDYAGRPAFLIDGAAYAGASGCPVVVPRPGITPVMGLPFGGQPILVGILARTFEAIDYQRADEVDIPMRTTKLHRIKTYLNTGLAFKSRTVKETIEHHRKIIPVDEVR